MVRLPIVDQMISLVRKPARGGGKPPAPNVREDRLRGGFDQAPVGLAYVAPDGHWLQYNERFRDTVGYTREQLGRISFNDLTHPDDAKKELALVRKLIAGEITHYRIEKRIIDKRGKYRTVDVTTGAVRSDAGVIEFYVHILDEPTAKQSGERIRDGEQLLVAAIDQLAEIALIRTDDRGLVTGWNAGAERIFGYGRDEVIGKHRRFLYRDADNWEGKATNQLNSVTDGRLEFEDWRVARNGQHLWVKTSITPLRRDGIVKGYVEVITAPPQKRTMSDAQSAELKRTVETLRDELTQRERTEESLRDALEQVRVMGEETMNELRIMAVALRNEIDRRKLAEDELRAAREQLASPPVAPPAPPLVEEEVIAAKPSARAWKRLGKMSPAEMLVQHATEHRTGTLLIASGEREKEIFFENGKIFSCASNEPGRFLTQRLIELGYINEEQRQKALEIAHETNLAIGRILLILGAITEQQLVDVMLAKTEDEIADVFEWRDAKFVFVDGEIPALQLVPLRIEVATLVVKRLSGGAAAAAPTFDAAAELSAAFAFDGDETLTDQPAATAEFDTEFDADSTQPVLRVVEEPVIGSTSAKSTKYHRPACMNAKRISAAARREFASVAEAVAAGLEPCRLCFK
ncbi:MAG TPA: PAS domain S-box protein [Thermoanaerobaculia bacterium]|nr:PAS domain S-box protein [Thermoanaerobaculia bacterium]